MSEANYSLFALPAYYLLTMFPHAYAIGVVKRANNGRWNNANPRGSDWTASLEQTVPKAELACFQRARAAHNNGLENLPLIASALIVGTVAKLPAETMNRFAAAYLISRVAYTFLYVRIERGPLSYLRTLSFFAGSVMCVTIMVKSALAILRASQ